MADYHTEEEQLEALKRWWQENGRAVIAGLAIGVAVLAGWRGWDWYRGDQALAASALYEEAMAGLGADDPGAVVEPARRLRAEYAGTAYAPLGALAAAKAQVAAGEPGAAEEWLRWAMDNAGEAGVRHIARARLARVRAAQGDHAGALALLEVEVPAAFTALYAEIRGDVLFAQGERTAAAAAYQEALDAEVPPPDPEIVRRKLNQVRPPGTAGGGEGAPS